MVFEVTPYVTSLFCHYGQIDNLSDDHSLHILALYQTKLDKNMKHESIEVDGFNIGRADKICNELRAAFYINNTLQHTIRENHADNSFQFLCIKMAPMQSRPFNLIVWYRPPSNLIVYFFQLQTVFRFLDNDSLGNIVL